MIEPKVEIIPARKLIGKRVITSLTNNKTPELWKSFMMRRKEIKNNVDSNLCSVNVYPATYFQHFNPAREYEKWAAVEVNDFNTIPDNMETLELAGGLYAIFLYKGSSSDTKIFDYIFKEWLPNSEYALDDRPHFEILGERYRNDSADSEEQILIPVR
jgi:AraC family transcriptional regulator